jgi:hypothetical protein
MKLASQMPSSPPLMPSFLAGQYGGDVDALGMQAGASASRNGNPAALTLAEWVMPQFEICGV